LRCKGSQGLEILIPAQNPSIPAKFPISNP
jgi:hypothetical protein